MSMRDLVPWGGSHPADIPAPYRETCQYPFLSLHREVNRLFDDALRGGFDFASLAVWPSLEVKADFNRVF